MMRICSGLILLTFCLLLTEKSGGSVQALRLNRILGIVDRFSQMSSSGASKAETITEDNTSEIERLAEEEDASPELLETEEDEDTEDIDRTHHQHHNKHKKAPIIATKTVFLQVTKHVTRHPVCMTVHGVKPPCLPAELAGAGHHHHDHHHDGAHVQDWWGREDIWTDGMQEEGLYIEPTATVRVSEATASADLPEIRAKDDVEADEDSTELVEPSTRTGRYFEMRTRETPAPPSTTTSSGINDQPEFEDRHLGSLMSHKHHKKDYKYVTKTLVVTKVQPVTDYRVTATLEAKNCIPHDVKIPFCPGPNAPYIPLSPYHPIVHGYPEQTIEQLEEVLPGKPVIFKPPHKPVKPILPLPFKPPHKPIKPIFDKPVWQDHIDHVQPPHHEKPEKPTKPIIPIISSIFSSHKPVKPVVLQEQTQHSLNGEASEQQEEVFDSVDENLKESEVTLEQ